MGAWSKPYCGVSHLEGTESYYVTVDDGGYFGLPFHWWIVPDGSFKDICRGFAATRGKAEEEAEQAYKFLVEGKIHAQL